MRLCFFVCDGKPKDCFTAGFNRSQASFQCPSCLLNVWNVGMNILLLLSVVKKHHTKLSMLDDVFSKILLSLSSISFWSWWLHYISCVKGLLTFTTSPWWAKIHTHTNVMMKTHVYGQKCYLPKSPHEFICVMKLRLVCSSSVQFCVCVFYCQEYTHLHIRVGLDWVRCT